MSSDIIKEIEGIWESFTAGVPLQSFKLSDVGDCPFGIVDFPFFM